MIYPKIRLPVKPAMTKLSHMADKTDKLTDIPSRQTDILVTPDLIGRLQQRRLLRTITGVRWQSHPGSNSPGPGSNSQSITPLILRMSCMPLDPMERNPVPVHQRCKPHPQIRVLDLCESLSLPVLKPPLVDGIHDIG